MMALKIIQIVWYSMLPIFELRLALPMAYFKYGFNIYESFFIAIIGNMIPIIFVLYFLTWLETILCRFTFFRKIFNWIYRHSEKAFSKNYEKWGKLGLVIFVGIPLPMTGAWTGAIASTIFKIKPKEAFWLIFCGVVLAGIIVASICVLYSNLALKWFF